MHFSLEHHTNAFLYTVPRKGGLTLKWRLLSRGRAENYGLAGALDRSQPKGACRAP